MQQHAPYDRKSFFPLRELNLPVSDYAFDDCKLMEYAQRCKFIFASRIADVAKLRKKIGYVINEPSLVRSNYHLPLSAFRLATTNIEESIVRNNFAGTEQHFVTFEEFVALLEIPADDYSYTLFKQFVEPGDTVTNEIDFKEYLNHTLLLVKIQEAKIEFARLLFLVSWLDNVFRKHK